MTKIEVKRVRSIVTKDDAEPHWEAVVDYDGFEVKITLPAHYSMSDDPQTQRREIVLAMESLANALLRFAEDTRKQQPHDWN